MNTIVVEVTREDIETGTPCDPNFCPIARAVRLATKFDSIHVGRYQVKGHSMEWPLPTSAQKFIVAFDAGHNVSPFSFTLENPNEQTKPS